MTQRYDNIVIQIITRVLGPFIQLYALYVIVFGHYGPGGGFQGGVILGTSVILSRLVFGRELSHQKFQPNIGIVLGIIGLLIYFFSGFIPLLTGGAFLDYSLLPYPVSSVAEVRSLGISIVELGIALAVMGACILVFDKLADGDS